nr:MBL fold metallo-hydrolase [bacterium]
MPGTSVQVTYLYHSGFMVRTPGRVMVFDYYRDTPDGGKRTLESGVVEPGIFARNKGLVLVSHAHEDHYNPVIFKWRAPGRAVDYVVSRDVPVRGRECTSLAADQQAEVDGAVIQAFGSTDQGVSFLVQADGVSIFHAGDLNFWHWKNESTAAEITKAKEDFLSVMQSLEGQHIDLAFFPVDARMGEGYAMGAAYFIKKMAPKVFVPMHFTAHPEGAARFAQNIKTDTRIWVPGHRGQEETFQFATR